MKCATGPLAAAAPPSVMLCVAQPQNKKKQAANKVRKYTLDAMFLFTFATHRFTSPGGREDVGTDKVYHFFQPPHQRAASTKPTTHTRRASQTLTLTRQQDKRKLRGPGSC